MFLFPFLARSDTGPMVNSYRLLHAWSQVRVLLLPLLDYYFGGIDHMKYLKNAFNKNQTPQNQPIPGLNQVQNNAGGFVFTVDDSVQMQRFLVLGSEGGSYYAKEQTLTKENAAATLRQIKNNGLAAVQMIVEISEGGRAAKNDPAIFALALAVSEGNDETRKAALGALNKVCRTGTHLLHFAEYVNAMRGWGRGLRSAVANWYTAKDTDALAYQLVKYQQRDGWSQRDVLRLAHPKTEDVSRQSLYHWVTQGTLKAESPRLVHAFEAAKVATSAKEIVELIVKEKLPREAIPTQFLTEKSVWNALLESDMPMTALLRNLATLTRVGVLADKEVVKQVTAQLTDAKRLKSARVHPIAVLSALRTYASGHGVRGNNTWSPIRQVVDALDAAFYASFGNITPTGKRWVLALDVSGSMGMSQIAGISGLTPRDASAAMALITAATEQDYEMVAFQTNLTKLTISPRQRLDDVIKQISNMSFGGTDCAQPMLWALKNKVAADVFVVYTDSETWHGTVHPVQALQQYRQQTGIAAKLIVVGMVASKFSIADPSDAGMLDVVGFDTATPQLMADFAL
jgi:60 kDa SS-A/Ro ribonucleoprotein